jgi:multiple sugar transport system permease protein
MTTSTAAQSGLRSYSLRRRWSTVGTYALLTALGALFTFPWLWTVTGSLKTASEVYLFPPPLLPKSAQISNYPEVLATVRFVDWFLNSTKVVALSTLGTTLSATVVAYSFARFQWRGRDVVFAITLATMMLPAEVTLIPQYLLYKELGWLNSIRPLWVPAWLGGGAFSIFLLRQFMMGLPREYDEAATIDGANPFRILMQVLIPLMKPVLATIAVITFIAGWGDFMGPLVYLNTPEQFTLAVGLRYFSVAEGQPGIPTQHLLMAACVMSTTPIVILFFCAQRYFVQGIVMSGLKG